LGKITETKELKKKKLFLDFIDTFTADVFKEKSEFATLSAENVKLILASDKLSIKEVEVFEIALAWGKAELKRLEAKASTSDKKLDLQTAMKDITVLVRFPTMEMGDVATKVTPAGILTNDQVLALYTYIGMRPGSDSKDAKDDEDGPKLPKALEVFKTKPRRGSTRPPLFDGAQAFTYNLYTLTNGGRTANKSQQNGTIYIIREQEVRSKGIHTIRVRCDAVAQHDNYNNDAIGFANEYYGWTNSTMNSSGAVFVNGPGQFYVDNAARQTGMFTITQGTVLTFVLDIEKKTVSVQATNGNNVSAVSKQDWYSCSGRVYFAMCWRYCGWQWTVLD